MGAIHIGQVGDRLIKLVWRRAKVRVSETGDTTPTRSHIRPISAELAHLNHDNGYGLLCKTSDYYYFVVCCKYIGSFGGYVMVHLEDWLTTPKSIFKWPLNKKLMKSVLFFVDTYKYLDYIVQIVFL